jgi:outer membrane receptor for ferrienterochelin and colicin
MKPLLLLARIASLMVLLLGAVNLLAPGAASAQVTGKVIGTVTDAETGVGLAGAQIGVVGAGLGNVTNEDGYYFITNVPVGLKTIRSDYLGYVSHSYEQRVLAGQTVVVDFALEAAVVPVDPLVAVIELEPLFIRDNMASKTRFTTDRARRLPVDNIEEVVVLASGIYEDEGDFIIRGGRASESATYVDGVFVSSFDIQRTRTEVGVFAVEEVDVITGGFNAEFGHAQSGIINIVTREGGNEFHGAIRFKTDGRFGTDGYDAEDRAAGKQEKCCGFNQLQASLGGPIVPGKLTFFGSFEATGAADIDPRAAGFNQAVGKPNSSGSTKTILPGNRGDQTRVQAKLAAFPTAGSKLTTTYLFSRDQLENHERSIGNSQFLTSNAERTKTHDVILNLDRRIFQTAERSVHLQVRGNYHSTTTHVGTPKSPEMAAILREALGDACDVECDVDESTFEDDFLNYRFGDIEFFFEDSTFTTIGSLPARNRNVPDPVFGWPQIWVADGFEDRFSHNNERRYGLRVDLDSQLNRVHRIKLGVEWNWINLSTESGSFPGFSGAEKYDVDPRLGALFVQHRLDYGDLVLDLGLRWDHWDPNTRVPLLPGEVNCSITPFPRLGCDDDAVVVDAPTRDELAPRLGVALPITDKTQIRLSYGKFHQLPELRHYFRNFTSDAELAFVNFFGNPNLDYVETTALEVGMVQVLSSDLVLDVVGYNRDRRGAIRFDFFQPQTIDPSVLEVGLPVNADNGNIKGLDITLSKRYSNYFSADIAWSLQWARGTTSSPTEFIDGFGLLFDPRFPGIRLVPPTGLFPESFDRTHVINAQFNLRFPGDFRAGTTVGTILRSFGLYFVYNALSGTPFTRTSVASRGFPIEDFNASRKPWTHFGDLRVTKGFDVSEALTLDLFIDARNVFDNKNALQVNPASSSPDQSGFERQNSETPFIAPAFKVEGATEGFPLPLDQILPEFRDAFGRQDLDGDGVIALEEAQETLFLANVAGGGASVFNYREPRQVRFGAEIRF